ncbi:CRISPR-associated endonuclease Cas2 [Persephonella sp.]
MRFIVCYDISDNRKRQKVAKLLKGFGIRTQFSVFEVDCSRSVIEAILIAVDSIIDPIDKFFVYPVDDKNLKKIKRIGAVASGDLINYI